MIHRLNAALQGRYRIERELGQGGMAIVYLAEDLKHDRKVAMKVLKPELAAVVGGERFLAEIKTTANLQHPHILPLHDSGEADGFVFYVMPYIEGETLRDRIEREGQLPVDQALSIAKDIAAALQYAHEQGVVHRDIKPANILLSRGDPLVADFGIALAVSQAGGGRITETGLSLGTPHYMSPEQATGDREIGPASDIYSLGAVLYEMLTGDPPYMGSTAQAVLGKIIQGEPVSTTAARKSVPANVDACVRKALERLPADRFTSARDFTRALADPAFRHGEAVEGATGPVATRWKRVSLALGAATMVLAGAVGWALTRATPRAEPIRVAMTLSPPVDLSQVPPRELALSPDGSFVVYPAQGAGPRQLWLRRLQDVEAVPIPGTENGWSPSISPDGTEVLFTGLPELALKAAPLGGGTVRTLADSVLCCARWEADGFVYYVSLSTQVARVPAAGGTPETLTDPEGGRLNVLPSLTLDQEAVLFGSGSGPAAEDAELRALRLATGEVTTVARGVGFGVQLPSGHVLLSQASGRLLAASFDAGALALRGEPVPVAEGVAGTLNVGHFAVSPSGVLAYLSGGSSGALRFQPVWVDRSGNVEPVDSTWFVNPNLLSGNRGFALSPDGSKVAVAVRSDGRSDQGDIYVKQLPDGPFSRLTAAPTEQSRPRWTPDGRSVTYLSAGEDGEHDLFEQRADGIGDPELLADEEESILEGMLTPDGWLILRTGNSIGDRDLNVMALRPGTDSVVNVASSPFLERAVALSPDGRWVAYESDDTGRTEVYVRSFPDPTVTKEQVSTAGGMMPVWGRTGRELFYVNGRHEMVAVALDPRSESSLGEQTPLFTIPPEMEIREDNDFYAMYDVDVDDQRFLMLRATLGSTTATGLVLVFNFLDGLDERLGGGR